MKVTVTQVEYGASDEVELSLDGNVLYEGDHKAPLMPALHGENGPDSRDAS